MKYNLRKTKTFDYKQTEMRDRENPEKMSPVKKYTPTNLPYFSQFIYLFYLSAWDKNFKACVVMFVWSFKIIDSNTFN